MSKPLTIAEAAEATGLSAYTLRYYEQIGLIAPVERRAGARRYGADDMRWLEFLVRLRATGMSMRDMLRYAKLLRQGPEPDSLDERQAMLAKHAERLESEMRMLGETLEFLRAKIRNYQTLRKTAKRACPPPQIQPRRTG